MKKGIILAIILFAISIISSIGQKQFIHFTTYNTGSNGLGSNIIYSVVENKVSEEIWFNTPDGFMTYLSNQFHYSEIPRIVETIGEIQFDFDSNGDIWYGYYDSVYFFSNGITTVHAIPGSGTYQDVCVANNGHIWFGCYYGLYRYDGSQFSHFETGSGLIGNQIRCILEDTNGNIWVGTNLGISKYNGSNWTSHSAPQGFQWSNGNSSSVQSIFQDNSGMIWVGGTEIASFDGNNWTIIIPSQVLGTTQSINNVSTIAQDSTGAIWFGTLSDGLIKYDNGYWSLIQELNGKSVKNINQILKDSNNRLWIATNSDGLILLSDCFNETISTSDGLAENYIRDIYEDQLGNIWFATKQGISQFINGQWQSTFNTISSGASKIITGDLDDHVITSSTGYLHRFNNNQWDSIQNLGGAAWVSDILSIGNNHYLIAAADGIVECTGPDFTDNLNWKTWTISEGLPDSRCNCIEEDSIGIYWVGTRNGIVQLIDSVISLIIPPADDFGKNIMDIRTDLLGNIWFATDNGIAKFSGLNWSFFYEQDGLVNNWVENIEIGTDSSIWFATYGGVSVYKNNMFSSITESDGLINNQTHCLEQDHNGNMWVGTQHGITKIIGAVYVDTVSNMLDIYNQKEAIIYPNPSKTTLFIELKTHPLDCQLLLYDLSGKALIRTDLNDDITVISTSFLSPGIYGYSIISKNEVISRGKWLKE